MLECRLQYKLRSQKGLKQYHLQKIFALSSAVTMCKQAKEFAL